MPPGPLDERRPAITPQLAVRVAVLGGVAFAVFAVVFFRLWFLQVLSGEDYVSQARDNRVRKVRVEAPRGDIVDRGGTTLVRTRVAPVVRVVPGALPQSERDAAEAYRKALSAAERARLDARRRLRELSARLRDDERRSSSEELAEVRRLRRAGGRAAAVAVPPLPADPALRRLFVRLGSALDLSVATIHRRVIEGIAEAPYSNVTVKTDVDADQFNFLRERPERYPGVEVEKLYLRSYPHKTLGAQLFGTLREIDPKELDRKAYRGVAPGARIGKDGIEETYDRYLRGRDGYTRVVINALGNRDEGRKVTQKDPVQGNQLKLSLDLGLQRAAEQAVQRGIAAANADGRASKAGAYVAMDPRNGEVLALGSYPSFDANLFAKPLSQAKFDALNSEAEGAPLFNRAVAATYPTGSTFKPITAIAALEEGVFGLGETIFDNGKFSLGDRTLQNARGASYGTVGMTRAMKVSSDVFFYHLGFDANDQGPVIQRWAKRMGLGRRTGIDLPGEFAGLVPDRRWRDAGYERYERCVREENVPARTFAALKACGGIERPWTVGDNVNLAIGQGDLQATPLQMAVAYSTLANGGKVVRPHLGLEVQDGSGALVDEIRTPARRRVSFGAANRDAIMEGLRQAAKEEGGTSYDTFKDFPYEVYGKTGTVQRNGEDDQAWYAAYVPHPKRPIVVVVTIERGGFGGVTAAPAARLILSKWFRLRERDFKATTSTD